MTEQVGLDASMQQELQKLKDYTLVVLYKGSAYANESTPDIIRNEHLPYTFTNRRKGLVSITMPMRDTGNIAAIGVFDTADKNIVKELMDNDPAVIKHIFTYEMLHAMGMQGDALL